MSEEQTKSSKRTITPEQRRKMALAAKRAWKKRNEAKIADEVPSDIVYSGDQVVGIIRFITEAGIKV